MNNPESVYPKAKRLAVLLEDMANMGDSLPDQYQLLKGRSHIQNGADGRSFAQCDGGRA